jgi:uncharacterized protein involved in outer membrane biogenesis
LVQLLPSDRRLRLFVAAGYAAAGLIVVALLTLALFPVGLFKGTVERVLSDRFGRPVTIGAIERTDLFSLTPEIVVRDLRVPQPEWAGSGELARVRRAELTLATGPLLHGRIAPTAIRLVGAHFALVRAKDGRENWHKGDQSDAPSQHTPAIRDLEIVDSTLSYRDAKRDRRFALALAADPRTGLVARGRGTVRGEAVAVLLKGAPIGSDTGRWPFTANLDGAALAMSVKGTMASPLDTDRMVLDMTARARDLKLIDAIIEAGLFETQPVTLSAHVERTAPAWKVTKLVGTIGRSRLSGHVDVTKVDGRTKIDGALASPAFDPRDLASDEGLAKGAALKAAIGPRLVPNTRVDIGKITHTDGAIRFRIARLLSANGDSALRDAAGTLTLARQHLEIAPLRIGLRQGAITGRLIVDQRGGARSPLVTIDLRMTGSSIGAVAGGGGKVTGRLDARAHLVGRGETIRAAVGNADGRIGVVARDGALPEKIADAIGFDAGRALFAGEDDRAGLRCVIFAADVRGGRGRVSPLIVDTTQSRLDGSGTIAFPSEALSLKLTGAPKRGAVLRLPGAAYLTGTLERPNLVVPKEVKSVGNIFKAIGRAITGHEGPSAQDANCAGLAARALR